MIPTRCRGVVARVALAAALAVTSGCAGDHGIPLDEQVRTADRLMRDLELDVVERAHVTRSKSNRWVSALATGEGGTSALAGRLETGLIRRGWDVRVNRPVAVSRGTSRDVIALEDGVVVRLALFDWIASRPPPAGTCWVQLSLAEPNDAFPWTKV